MTILYAICGLTLFISLVNLLAVIFLSNSMFRVIVRDRADYPPIPVGRGDSGLVELKDTPTYDPRFRR